MPVDQDIAATLDLIAAAGYPPMHHGTPETGRKALRAMTCDLVKPEDVIPVGDVEELTVPGADGDVPARLYRPNGVESGADSWPTTVYLHGGGFVIGDLATHDQVCRRVCRDAETVVLSVDYRLAPEHPFPAGADDALTVATWAAEQQLGGTDRLAITGDSAGGNLAAVVTQALPGALMAQLLIYPATAIVGDFPSRNENAQGYLLELDVMEWFFTHYTTDVEGVDPHDPKLSPLYAGSLRGLPPAVVVTAEYDPLRDEGEAYAERLAADGVLVDHVRYDGLIHGFMDLAPASPATDSAVADLVARFRKLLHP